MNAPTWLETLGAALVGFVLGGITVGIFALRLRRAERMARRAGSGRWTFTHPTNHNVTGAES